MVRWLAAIPLCVSASLGQVMTIHASPEPVPALRADLLRRPIDAMGERDGAVHYLRAAQAQAEAQSALAAPIEESFLEYLDCPLDHLLEPGVRERIDDALAPALGHVRRAQSAGACDWGVGGGDFSDPMMPELAQFRRLARLISVRAREQMARGDLDGAIDSITLLIRMGDDLTRGGTVLQALVGQAITLLGIAQIREFVQQPGAPNLYWSLARLDRSRSRVVDAVALEMHSLLPPPEDLDRIMRADVSPGEAEELARRINDRLLLAVGERGSGFALAGAAIMNYPAAKADLRAMGKAEAEIEALPVTFVATRYAIVRFVSMRDDVLKWAGLPNHESLAGLVRTKAEIEAAIRRKVALPMSLVLPAMATALVTDGRVERDLAALRCVEALRLHAHVTGSLPDSLADVAVVPVPPNPLLGQAFEWSREGDRGTLRGLGHEMLRPHYDSITFELTLAR